MGTHPWAPSGPASPQTPPGTLPPTVPAFPSAPPWTGPGISPDAPSGVTTSQAVPSGFTHGGGGPGSAAAIGASAMAAADAPAKSSGVRVFILAFMQNGYPPAHDA